MNCETIIVLLYSPEECSFYVCIQLIVCIVCFKTQWNQKVKFDPLSPILLKIECVTVDNSELVYSSACVCVCEMRRILQTQAHFTFLLSST